MNRIHERTNERSLMERWPTNQRDKTRNARIKIEKIGRPTGQRVRTERKTAELANSKIGRHVRTIDANAQLRAAKADRVDAFQTTAFARILAMSIHSR